MILVSKGTYQTNSWSAPFPKKATRYDSQDLDEAFAKTYGQRELLHYVNVHTSIDHTLEQADISWGRISKSAGYYRVETRHVDARKSQNEDKVNHGGRQQRHAHDREQALYEHKGLQVQQKVGPVSYSVGGRLIIAGERPRFVSGRRWARPGRVKSYRSSHDLTAASTCDPGYALTVLRDNALRSDMGLRH